MKKILACFLFLFSYYPVTNALAATDQFTIVIENWYTRNISPSLSQGAVGRLSEGDITSGFGRTITLLADPSTHILQGVLILELAGTGLKCNINTYAENGHLVIDTPICNDPHFACRKMDSLHLACGG